MLAQRYFSWVSLFFLSLLGVMLAVFLVPAQIEAKPALNLAPLRLAPDPATAIDGQYIVVYKPEAARSAAESNAWIASLGGMVLHTYDHALQGVAVANLSEAALQTIQADPAVAYVEQNQWVVMPDPSHPQGDRSMWLPQISRADEETTPSPTPSVSPSVTEEPSATSTTTPSATASATAEPTQTATASPTPTPPSTNTPTATGTATATPTASPTATIPATATATPSPTGTATVIVQNDATWGLDRVDQRLLPLNMTYTYSLTGDGVHAYIVDSGIRPTHIEFTGRMGNGFDAVDNDNNPDDCLGHGTHVAGTVGGTTYGVAKEVTLHGVRVLGCNGGGTLAGILAGVDWIMANYQSPAVVNMSFGSSVNATIDAAVESLITEGMPVIAAAGNSNTDACASSPAHIPNAITVGSTDMADVRSEFSNYGTCLDLFAPGSAILSAWHLSDTATHTIDGTSHAAPHVAGLAVLYLSVNPDATPAEVTVFILTNATPNLVQDPQGSPNLLMFSPYGEEATLP